MTTQEQKEIIEINQRNKNLTKEYQNVKRELPKYWDKEYINQVLDNISNSNDAMLCRFLWMSGVRITEALSLTKKDIDFKNYMMKVKWLKNRKYKERIVPIHPALRNILQIYTAAANQDDRIFPISRQRAWQIVQKYFQGHPHQFRHSFAVNWLRSDADIVTLHRILGHTKFQTTQEYLKIVPVDQGKELIKVSFE